MAGPVKRPGRDRQKGGPSVVGLAIVTLLASGAGVLTAVVLPPSGKTEGKSENATAPPAEVGHDATSTVVPLEPIVTNLGEPRTTWVRLEASLILKRDAKAKSADLAKKIGEDFIAFLRTLSLDQIATPSGYQHLYEDLNDRAKLRGEQNVMQLIITGFIVE